MRVMNLRWVKNLRGAVGHAAAALMALPRALSLFRGSFISTAGRALRVYRREGLAGISRRLLVLTGGPVAAVPTSAQPLQYAGLCPQRPVYEPLVTVIVPNYNHASYLEQRLDSIYCQTYPNFEVVLLDDCSTDDSRRILQAYAKRYPERTRLHFNDNNSGGVFHQWKKGLELARGELIWMAESDDYCAPNFLEHLVSCFRVEGVRLAFGFSEFVEGGSGKTVWTQTDYLRDLGMGQWKEPFVRSAHALMKSAWVVKNIVPNVSGAVFRHPGRMALLDDEQWLNLRLCGDWVFYANCVRGGLVVYSPDAVNYYRQHEANTSVNAQKEAIYYREHEEVARRLVALYALDIGDLKRQEDALYRHWCARHGMGEQEAFYALYDPRRALETAPRRLPNILMAVYALVAGGGETFPIMLANELARKGYGLTLLNCAQQDTEPGVRSMISPQVPLLEIERFEHLAQVCDDMNIDIVHTHHAWCDMTFATWLLGKANVRQVVTLHGMYETLTDGQRGMLMRVMQQRADALVYTAEKNLRSVPAEIIRAKPVTRIDNALPQAEVKAVARESLGIGPDDFVLCLVSRAIPEKGWAEAARAVGLANARARRRIVLVLIGEGPEYDRMASSYADPNVILLGFRANVRDYFAMADMGFLPSRFHGESAPLVLIDCLLAGKAVLASDVGEIRYMLETPEGLAGEVFSLHDWHIDCDELAETIVQLCDDPRLRVSLDRRVAAAARKFEVGAMVEAYEAVYGRALAATGTQAK